MSKTTTTLIATATGTNRHPQPAREEVGDPHRLARIGLASERSEGLRFWRDEFWRWNGTRYERVSRTDFDAALTTRIKAEYDRWAAERDQVAKQVNRSTISNVRLALEYLARSIELDPAYRDLVDEETDFDPIRDDPGFVALTSFSI